MSSYLLDTSILVRLIVSHDPLRPVAKTAIAQLRGQALAMSVAAQCVIELWAVSTRPLTANGLGLSTATTASEVDRILSIFPVLDDPPTTLHRWRQLAQSHEVKGRQVYDARLAAVMIESSISHILTFNVDDFRRYPGITAASPHRLAAPSTPTEPGTSTK